MVIGEAVCVYTSAWKYEIYNIASLLSTETSTTPFDEIFLSNLCSVLHLAPFRRAFASRFAACGPPGSVRKGKNGNSNASELSAQKNWNGRRNECAEFQRMLVTLRFFMGNSSEFYELSKESERMLSSSLRAISPKELCASVPASLQNRLEQNLFGTV